ncbi:YhgE/Pip family protein [Mycobacteroides abscessus subsp. massiliense]|uniref:YhgE/Pip family protein n=1 Tax=Mycobacteroides abscessus TaxID=36809 RepID=UPI00266D36DF|nr:YhgE/Pip family protein [Mycobacteroides abscessus]MDO3297758.1 YhgE/Pip family protein [Mycobacteroides abscessus subsp. massiliense]
MITPFENSARVTASGPLTWRTWTGLVLLPILVMSLFLWAFWSPEKNHGAAKAAVVNNDRPVTVNGQILPLGRKLAGDLTHTDSAYSWLLTDATDAKDGLASGRYGAVVTIPENFSAKATSSAGSNPMEAGQAELRVQTSNATGVADPLISTHVAQVVLRTLNQQIVETYLENVYISMSTLHDQLDQAADGAKQLSDGADKLKSGAAQLTSGSGQLASGLTDARNQVSAAIAPLRQLPALPPGLGGPIAGVAGQLQQAVSRLNAAANGANQLHKGSQQLEAGISELADGNRQLATELAQGRDKVPAYDQAQRDRLKNVAATPSVAITDNTNVGAAVAAVAIALALWACALATYVITRAVPSAVLTSRQGTWRIVARAALPGATVAALAAGTLAVILLPILDLSIGRWFALLGITLLTALTFVALNQAMAAIFKRPGRFASITVLVLALITSLMSTIPTPLHTIGGHLPTYPAILALRGVIIGSDVVANGIIQLALWLVISMLATVLVTEQRRVLSSTQLRLGSTLSAAT